MPRYYLGVDWADRVHQLYSGDENGTKVMEMKVQENPDGMAELGRWLDQSRAEQVELWVAIEKPHGRIVDFLLDHGVVVYPVNPKVLDRARDRFRMSQSKSDPFDAWVLSDFLRTDHGHLRPLRPSSEQAQELKMLTRDQQRMVRHKTRLLNQLKITLKEYYPRPVEVFGIWSRVWHWIFSSSIRRQRRSRSLAVSSGADWPSSILILVKHAGPSCGRT